MILLSARTKFLNLRLVLGVFSLVALVQSQAVDPPWEVQTFDFGWSPINNTLTQCRELLITWASRPVAGAPAPTPPYYLVWWLAGYEPYKVNMGAGTTSGLNEGFTWIVNIPTGGPYINSMEDSAGGTGGVADVVNVQSPTGPCQTAELTLSRLEFVVPNAQVQCSTLQLSVSNGTPPYTLIILPENFAPKTVSYSTGVISYLLDVPAGTNTYLAVEDSTGKAVVAPSFVVAGGSDASCLTAAPSFLPGSPQLSSIYPGGQPTSTSMSSTSASSSATPSSSAGAGTAGETHSKKTAMIAGIAAAAGAVVVAIIAFILWRRHRNNIREAQHVHATDFDRPHVDPLYGAAVPERRTSGYTMASGYHPNHGGPSMTNPQYGGGIVMSDMTPSSSNLGDSAQSSYPTTSQALLEARRNERKIDPVAAGAYYTRPLHPNASSSSGSFHASDPAAYSATSSGAVPQRPGSFAVANQGRRSWEEQEAAAARRVSSPPLPLGAALPISMQRLGPPNPGFLPMSTITMSTPPPQYSSQPMSSTPYHFIHRLCVWACHEPPMYFH